MKIEFVRRFHRASPFHHFIIHMADGRNIPIVHPESLRLSPEEDECVAFEPDGTFHFIDVELVTDLERVKPARKRPSNGKKDLKE